MDPQSILLEWHAPNHMYRPKTVRWYIAFAAIATALIALLIVLGNFIAAIAVGCVSVLLYYILQQKPPLTHYRLMDSGVAVNTLLYPYSELEAFNIIHQPDVIKTVIIRSKRRFAPFLHIELGENDPSEIRNVLLQFLQEDTTLEEPFIDVLARRLGF